MKRYTVNEVFTPASPATLTYISRTIEERQFLRALDTTGKQIIIYGHSGSGKTTFLKNILKKERKKHVITRCTKGITLDRVLDDAFHQLNAFYTKTTSKRIDAKVKADLGIDLKILRASLGGEGVESDQENQQRIVDFQRSPNELAKLLGISKLTWIIEDFHKLDLSTKKELSQVMKVFMDSAGDYNSIKIIATGAVDTARDVVHYDSEMNNRISEIKIPLMETSELLRLIEKGEALLNIKFDQTVNDKIIAYSSGLASVTHQLCSLCCESKGLKESSIKNIVLNDDDLEYAVSEYINEKSDSLKSSYELAIKEINRRQIETPTFLIHSILKVKDDSFHVNEIEDIIKRVHPKYKGTNLRKYLNDLTRQERGEILRYNSNADKYSFANPFLKGYCHINDSGEKTKDKKINHHIKLTDISLTNADLLRKHLNDEYNRFLKDLAEDYIFDGSDSGGV